MSASHLSGGDPPDAADETLLRSEYHFQGRLVKLRVDTVRLASGREATREIVEHPGAIAVVPQLPDGRVILIRQYRRPAGQALLEIPAGTREPDEDAETCARRELEEEIGYRAGRLERLGGFYTSPGFCTEYMDLYLASDLTPLEGDEPAEFEEAMVIIHPSEVPAMLAAGEPFDAKTIAAVLLVAGR
jgi:ADP-ribose pyrophosphatase